jgi:hypothetical protein
MLHGTRLDQFDGYSQTGIFMYGVPRSFDCSERYQKYLKYDEESVLRIVTKHIVLL